MGAVLGVAVEVRGRRQALGGPLADASAGLAPAASASSTPRDRTGWSSMLTSATRGVPFMTAATPTIAQSWARRVSFCHPQRAPGCLGTRTSVRISSAASAVSRKPLKNVVGRDLALPPSAAGDERRTEREAGGREIRRRVAMSERPSDRAPVPDLRIADLTGDVGEQRGLGGEQRVGLDVAMAGESTDGDVVPAVADVGQLAQPADVDQHRR